MGFLDKMRDWQDRQIEKGEARIERLEAKMATFPVADYGGISVYPNGSMTYRDETHPAGEPATARIEKGEDLEKRVTVTRLVALGGIGGLIWKKRSGGESWLTVESDSVFWVVEVPRGEQDKARKFVAAVNRLSRISA